MSFLNSISVDLLSRNRNYRLLYLGQFSSFMGTMITNTALPYQVYSETHSTLLVGLLSLFQLLPILVTALIGGIFADRYQRLILVVVSELLLAIGCILLAGYTFFDVQKSWILFSIAMTMAAINSFHRPALSSLTQQLVAKEDYHAVGVLSAFMYSTSLIAGPAVAGLLIAHYGVTSTFLIDLLTYFIALFSISRMRNIPNVERATIGSHWLSLAKGIRYAAARQELIGSYLIDFLAMFSAMPKALFPALAVSYGGAEAFGILNAAPAVGALFISLGSHWIIKIRHIGLAITITTCLWAIAIVFLGFTTTLWSAVLVLVLAGALDAISWFIRSIMWNTTIPNEYRGRLAGIEIISYISGPKLGDVRAGITAAALGITASIVSGGLLCLMSVATCCYFLPKFFYYQSEKN